VSIAKDVKNQQLFTDLYAGITTNVKKINYYLQDLEVGIAMDIKNQQLFTRPMQILHIWNGLMEVIIERM